MRNFDDSKIYLAFAITTLVIAILVGAVSYYSILVVEPKVDRLLSATDDIHSKYSEAFRYLSKGQLFARYQHFDQESSELPKVIMQYNRKAFAGEEFFSTDMRHLEDLLERRKQGSRLGRYTMFFFLMLTLLGWGMFFYEKRKVAKSD